MPERSSFAVAGMGDQRRAQHLYYFASFPVADAAVDPIYIKANMHFNLNIQSNLESRRNAAVAVHLNRLDSYYYYYNVYDSSCNYLLFIVIHP